MFCYFTKVTIFLGIISLSMGMKLYSQQSSNKKVATGEISKKKRFLLKETNDTLSLSYGDKVYFTKWSITRETGKKVLDTCIYVFNTNNGETNVLIAAKNEGELQLPKGELVNMMMDRAGGKLFFTTNEKEESGNMAPMTWLYDLNSGEEKIFKEGKVAGVDMKGNVSIFTYSSDWKGTYTHTIKYSTQGVGVEVGKRDYTNTQGSQKIK